MTHVGTLDRGFSVQSIIQTGIINAILLLFFCLEIFILCGLCLPAAALPQYPTHVPHCWCVASFLTCSSENHFGFSFGCIVFSFLFEMLGILSVFILCFPRHMCLNSLSCFHFLLYPLWFFLLNNVISVAIMVPCSAPSLHICMW